MLNNNKISSFFRHYHLGHLIYTATLMMLFFVTLSQKAHPYIIFIPLALAFISILINAIKSILNKKITTELFLVIATCIALIAHQEQAITVVLLIMLIAQYFEKLIEEKTDRAIASLVTLIPTNVRIQSNNRETMIPLEDVQYGMLVIVKTGEQIPVDGTIVQGSADVNESFLTGESIPNAKTISHPVFAGTFIASGSITVNVQKTGTSTVFGKIHQLLKDAETSKARIVTISNQAALIIMPLLIVFIGIVWLITGNLTMVATLLVFGSPIELTLITPMAILAGTAAAFQCGILIKGSLALERLHAIDTLIFDKTGTLTIGQPKVVSIIPADATISEHEILTLAAIVERGSGHVLAQAIVQKAYEENIVVPNPESYESVTGHGVIATYNGHRYILGSKHFIQAPEHGNTKLPHSLINDTQDKQMTTFYLISESKVYGKICLSDTIRPDAQETIYALKQLGIKNFMLLSGDKLEIAQHIAAQLGIETAYGEITPDAKLAIIKNIQEQGHRVGMIGDGINDAPALKQADVGIALGAMGMEPAIQAADIILMANNLNGIVFTRALSQKIIRVIMQNIFLGFVFIHLIGIVLTLLGLATPIQAALFHAASDLLIMLNSARLIRFKLQTHPKQPFQSQ